MGTFLAILLVAAMVATLAALVRGVVIFLRGATEEVRNGDGPSAASLKSNKAMVYRIVFQGIALMLVALLLLLYGRH